MGIILPGWICTSAATSHLLGIWCADHRACSLDECWAVWDSFRIEPLSWNSVLLITIEAFSSLWAMDLSGSVNISELREEGEKMGECFGGFAFDVFNSHLLSFGPSRWSLTGASASPKTSPVLVRETCREGADATTSTWCSCKLSPSPAVPSTGQVVSGCANHAA